MKKKTKTLDYKAIALELQKRVIWALRFMKCPGSGLVAHTTRDKNGKLTSIGEIKHWTFWFADGAELLGNCKIDRELMGLNKEETAKLLKARAKASGKS